MSYHFRAALEADARVFASWRYTGDYAMYNPDDDDYALYLDPANQYYAIIAPEGQLIGYFCLGEDARVPGGVYDQPALDLGVGLRPELTGKGLGRDILTSILDYLKANFNPPSYRVTIATFNQRAIRLCRSVGFIPTRTFIGQTKPRERPFIQMIRPA